jgi:hypothetical protein
MTRLTAISLVCITAGLAAGPASTAPSLRAYPSCPRHDRHPIVSTTVGADTAMVPRGARQVLLCRYSGVGPRRSNPLHLVSKRLVRRIRTVDRLTAELNGLRKLTGPVSCAADSGAAIIAFFRYAQAAKADDPVTVGLSGCVIVTNGRLTRTAFWPPGPAMLRSLKRMTRSH